LTLFNYRVDLILGLKKNTCDVVATCPAHGKNLTIFWIKKNLVNLSLFWEIKLCQC
jgi:hypothetical protein